MGTAVTNLMAGVPAEVGSILADLQPIAVYAIGLALAVSLIALVKMVIS